MVIQNLTTNTYLISGNYVLLPSSTVTISDATYDADTLVADQVNALVAASKASQSGYGGSFPRVTGSSDPWDSAPVTGVAVNAGAIHAALVTLGLITA